MSQQINTRPNPFFASSLLSLSISILSAGFASAALTTTLDYTASTDPDGGTDSTWEDSAAGGHDFNLGSGVTYSSSLTGAPSGVTAVYNFDGTSNALASWGSGNNMENITAGNPTNSSSVFELVFRPGNITDQSVLWEFGGSGAGISMTMNGSTLQLFDSRTSSGVFATDLVAGEFYHAVGTIEYGTTNLLSLYLNGVSQGSVTHDGSDDWAGTDGGTDGSLGGKTGSTYGGQNTGDIGGYGQFEGDIAAFRLYADQTADQTEIDSLFASTGIVPEPSTTALLGLGGLALILRRRN